MASIIKVDALQEKTSGNGIVLENSLKDSTGTNEIISSSGSVTIPSGQSINNSSGTSLIDATGTMSSDMVFPANKIVNSMFNQDSGYASSLSAYDPLEIVSLTTDTAKSPTNKHYIICNGYYIRSNGNTSYYATIKLVKGGTVDTNGTISGHTVITPDILASTTGSPVNGKAIGFSMSFVETLSSTDPITYRICLDDGSPMAVNSTSSISVFEIQT